MTEGVNTTRPARRFTAGLAACFVATAGVIALAWPDRDASSIAVDYQMEDDRILASGLQAAPERESLQNSRAGAAGLTARDYLERLSRTGDARYLRYAKMALDGAGTDFPTTFDRMMLTARILQAEHNFSSAADTLRQALAIRGNSAEALLLLSDSLRRGGFPADARAACVQLALIGESALAKWCGIQVLQSLGAVQRAYEAQQGFMNTLDSMPIETRVWALSVAADSAAYATASDEAYALYVKALSLGESTLALRLAFADFLIDDGRYGEVADVLAADRAITAALLRVAIANNRIDNVERSPAVASVEASLQMAATTNDETRLRDRAIWELGFRGDADAAHDLALANWTIQKAYEDFALLRDAAAAAGRTDTLAMLDDWLAKAVAGGRS